MKFIILGTGQAAKMNLVAARRVKGMELAAVHSSDPERGQRFASRHRTVHVTNVCQVAERGDIEAAIIASTPDMHRRQLSELLDRVPYIFVEKPFGLSAAEARLMAEMADRSTSSVAVLYKHRFDEAYERMRQLVQSGTLGRILNVTFIMSRFRDDGYLREHGGWRGSLRRSGGGVLLQQGIHWINFIFGIFGYETETSSVVAFKDTGRDLEDCISIHMNHSLGFTGNLIFSRSTAPMPETLEILGTEACVRYIVPHLEIFKRRPDPQAGFGKRFWTETTKKLPVSIQWRKTLRQGGNQDVLKSVIDKNARRNKICLFVEEAVKDQEFIETAVGRAEKWL